MPQKSDIANVSAPSFSIHRAISPEHSSVVTHKWAIEQAVKSQNGNHEQDVLLSAKAIHNYVYGSD